MSAACEHGCKPDAIVFGCPVHDWLTGGAPEPDAARDSERDGNLNHASAAGAIPAPAPDAAKQQEFAPYTGMTWLAYLCAAQGHIRRGLGYDSNPDNAVWASNCERCGAKL